MEQTIMDGAITPAAELASGADGFNTPNKTAHLDWTQILHSYDQEYAQQVASVTTHMQRFVAQLLHGCGHADCKLQHCATGLRNTTRAPIRDYTPRSARILALELLHRPHCDAHVCRYLQLDTHSSQHAPDENPRDPSSFIQRLADTSYIRQLARGEAPTESKDKNPISRRARAITGVLQLKCEAAPFLPSGSPNPLFASNKEVTDIIAMALELFYELLPEQSNPATWQSLAQHINNGRILPSATLDSSGSHSDLIQLLEIFACEPYIALCAQICKVIALRTLVEDVTAKFRQERFDGAAQGNIITLLMERMTLIARSQTASGQESWVPWPYPLWFKKAFLKHWDGKPSVKRGTIACGALELLEMQQKIWDRSHPLRASDATLLPYIYKRVDAAELMRTWMQHDPPVTTHSRHLLSFRFLYSDGQMLMNSRMLNHLRMRQAHTLSHVNEELFDRYIASSDTASLEWDNHAPETQHLRDFYLLLTVRRDNLMQDTFDQLWQRRRCELLRPLRIRLGEMEGHEVGQDLGGVQIEFFNLICKALFVEDVGMFNTDAITGLSYFRPGSLQPLYMFELFGLLVALAVYNGITIPVSFPVAFYKHLLGIPCTDLRDIQDGWPDVARSLQFIKDGAYEGLDYVFPLEANGLRMSVSHHALKYVRDQSEDYTSGKRSTLWMSVYEMSRIDAAASGISVQPSGRSWPGWAIYGPRLSNSATVESSTTTESPLHTSNVPTYIADYADWLTRLSVLPQLTAFKKGFHTLLSQHHLALFTPTSLSRALEGSATLDLAALRRATQYKDYTATEPYIVSLWNVLARWPQAKQKALLKFVTAAERIPITGASALTFRIQLAGGMDREPELLPTSSTCFGTLYLPRYKDEETLERKLEIALEFGGVGFGTA